MFSRKKLFSSKSRRVSEPALEPDATNESSIPSERSKSVGSASGLTTHVEEVNQQDTVLAHRPNSASPSNVSDFTHRSRSDTYSSINLAYGPDPLGLTLLHAPADNDYSADIMFVHGLGGTSRMTWCKHRRMDLFWPQEWLPQEDELRRTRIFTFGYDAKFKSASQNSSIGISDFAKSLLYNMMYARDPRGGPLHLGQVPIIFVAHSMGGLVFKKAFLDAKLDNRYANIIDSVKGAVFLSTPHHGADLAQYLNRVLSLTFGSTSKQYIADLDEHGPFLQTVNEQFRNAGGSLRIFSFFETQQTSFVGMSSAFICDRRTAHLGWPGEVTQPLGGANHANICKFESRNDANYQEVANALKHLMDEFAPRTTAKRTEPEAETHLNRQEPLIPEDEDSLERDLDVISSLLSVSSSVDHDLELFSRRRAEGTCSWVLDQAPIRTWLDGSTRSDILWMHGRPGRGKSITASFLAQHLRESKLSTQHFFFRSGDESKKSTAALIRGLTLQIAKILPTFRKALIELGETGWKPKDSEWRSTWKKVFINLLFDQCSSDPMYWIIDGIDEAGAPNHLFELLSDIGQSKTPIKVILTSRWTPNISAGLERVGSKVPYSDFSLDNDLTDMEIYVEEELGHTFWGDEVIQEVKEQILARAQDNFLWVHLIMDELKDCYTEEDIRERLLELPPGMDGLYKRMEETITRITRPKDRDLARHLLTWAMHSRRSLAADELTDVLEPAFGRILGIAQIASRLCGHFIAVEVDHKISLIHQTARDYLAQTTTLGFSLNATPCHAEIFDQCMKSFLDKALRSKLQRASPKLYEYRATCWPHHLAATELWNQGDSQLDLLSRFFSHTAALTWVYLLASLGQLKVLIEASRALHTFVRKKRRTDAAKDPTQRRFDELERLDQWSRDLLKILGKFGSCLSQVPETIFIGVAPFCPTSSSMFKSFGSPEHSSLRVQGLMEDWADSLARVSTGTDSVATLLCCSGRYLAVGNSVGTVNVWDCETFHAVNTLEHQEMISSICFSAKGDRTATYGFHTTKVWNPKTGNVLQTIRNLPDMRALCLHFVEDDSALLVGTDRRFVLRAAIESTTPATWQHVNSGLLSDNDSLDGAYTNSPTCMAISPDGTKIAVVYRRFPATIWSIESGSPIRRISRIRQSGQTSDPLPFVLRVSWHPNGDEVLGIFMGGASFKLNIVDGTIQETPPYPGQMPQDIVCSPDGLVYAICGVNGTIRLFDYQSSTLIYQLNSDEMMSAFRFSHDGRRFYDIRGSYCTIWEPNALMRLAAVDDDAARSQVTEESVRQSQVASEASVDKPIPILVMKPSLHQPLACFGDEDGNVLVQNYETSGVIRAGQTPTQMCVEHLAWGDDGQRFCYAELNGRVTVMQVEKAKSASKAKRLDRFKTQLDSDDLVDVLWTPGSSSLLVAKPSHIEEWTVQPAKMQQKWSWGTMRTHRKWLVHPVSQKQLLAVTPRGVSLHSLEDLKEKASWIWEESGQYEQSPMPRTFSEPIDAMDISEEVTSFTSTFLQNHCLLRISRKTSSRKLRPRFLIFDASVIDTQSATTTEKIAPIHIPRSVKDLVEMPLNVLSNGKLVFIDRSFWVCSWPLNSTRAVDDVQRHFFIPRDWLPVQSLGMLHITSAGAILCPRAGGICVIHSSIGSVW